MVVFGNPRAKKDQLLLSSRAFLCLACGVEGAKIVLCGICSDLGHYRRVVRTTTCANNRHERYNTNTC